MAGLEEANMKSGDLLVKDEIDNKETISVEIDHKSGGWMAVTYTSEDGLQTFHGMLLAINNRNDVPGYVNSEQANEWKQKLSIEAGHAEETLAQNEVSSSTNRVSSNVGSARRQTARPIRLRPAASRLVCLKCRGPLETVTEGAAKRKMELNCGERKKPRVSKILSNPVSLSPPPKLEPQNVKPLTIRLAPDRRKGVIVRKLVNDELVDMCSNVESPGTSYIRVHSNDSEFVESIRSPQVALSNIVCPPIGVSNSDHMPLLINDDSGQSNSSFAPSIASNSLPKLKKNKIKTSISKKTTVPLTLAVQLTPENNPLGLKVGDAVWAKMFGEPYWPAKIFAFNPGLEVCVLWLGSSQHGFVSIDTLEQFHTTFPRRYSVKRTTRGYQKAVFEAVNVCIEALGNMQFLDNVLLHMALRKMIQNRGISENAVSKKRKKIAKYVKHGEAQDKTSTVDLESTSETKLSAEKSKESGETKDSTGKRRSFRKKHKNLHKQGISKEERPKKRSKIHQVAALFLPTTEPIVDVEQVDSENERLVIDESGDVLNDESSEIAVQNEAMHDEVGDEHDFDGHGLVIDEDETGVLDEYIINNHQQQPQHPHINQQLHNEVSSRDCAFDSIISELQQMNSLCPPSPIHSLTT